MPRKPRITAVPVDQAEGLMVATELPEEKTDAEQMTEIIKEVKEESKEEPREAISDAPVAAKAKAKRASRAKPKEEPVKEEPLEDEPKEEQILTQEPKEEARIDDKVACPDCGKQMSAKTLKYSHVANCVTKKPKTKTEKNRGTTTCLYPRVARPRGHTKRRDHRGVDRAPHPNTHASRKSTSQGNDVEQPDAISFLIF